ncbi:MAG TPA: non-ribosomal peptide synthase/polyketide synthase, partial [Longimicrobium sp.]
MDLTVPSGEARSAACVHELFRAQAARTPDAAALVWQGERLTYAELERRANRISHALRRRGAGPEVRVGICLPRTLELVPAMLGVLGAGAAYVPLDPAYPRERLGYMLEDAAVTLVITDSTLVDRLPEGLATLLLDRERDALAAEPDTAFESGVVPENLSHVIFTSGSTGRPKGVMIRHSSTVVLLHWLRETITDAERASVLFSTSINFDVSVAEVFGTLSWGGTLVLVENALELATLDEPVVHVSMVPSAAAELLHSGGIPASVRTLNLGGEALPNALAQGLYALPTVEKVGNLYGPTEDTTYSTYSLVPRGADRVLVGAPVANTRAYVLDAHLQPVPVGAEGELYLAGDGLSRGYAGRPGMTAERFVPCPFGAPGGRMYRVMDRVRRRVDANGELEYLGRTDFQVKVRGFRIELGEIESRLVEHPGVRAAVVLAREDVPGDTRLVAYVAGDETASVDALRAHLAERLPAYMVPAAYVRLEALPQTPNGKVDRKALPAPAGEAFGARAYEAPADATEQALAGIWAELLGTERVGRGDDFFELGGHSLLAVRVVSRLRQALGVETTARDFFERPVLADFAAGLRTAARADAAPIELLDRTGPLAPSFAQQRLWFLEQLGGTAGAYNIPLRLRLQGELDRGALAAALEGIIARHEALRTTFPAVDGEPVQRIASIEESAFRLVEHDLRAAPDGEDALRRIASEEAGAPFDLEHGPLIRGRLVRITADEHVLLVTMHHVVSDGWSMGVFVRELGALYDAFRAGGDDPLPALPIQYADYAAWQRRWVSGERLERQAGYWMRTLAGAPELLELPTDRPRPRKQDFAGDALTIELDEALTAALKALSRRHGTTLFMTLLAGWATVLGRLSGQTDVVVGTPTANRGRSETEALIGFFVNTLALRVDLSAAPTVAELLGQVRARALEAQQHPDIPFEQVVERVRPVRSLAYSPLFQVMFAWQNTPDETLDLAGLRLVPEPETAQESARFDLTLELAERDGRIAGVLSYATALFDRATVERHAGYLRRVLAEMAADEHRPVDRLALLPEAERRLVLEELNRTAAAHPAACIHELFRAQAARTPDAAALVWQGERLTYAELERRANRISHALRRRGAGPEVRVGICLPRTLDLVPAMLGVLGAGAAYVPLDPAYPRERLGYMLEDAGVTLVITDSTLADRLPEGGLATLLLDRERDALAAEPDTAFESGVLPENLSHVIFTSGSTGRPKGVMIRHSSTVVLLHWLRETITDAERASVLFSTSINFDVSVAEVFGTLSWGGTLVLVENALELATLDEPVVHVSMVPSAAAELLRSGGIPASVRTLNLGGEALPNALAQGLYALPTVEKVGNLYGPTEDTTYSTYSLVPRGADRVLVGAPVANTRAYVLDAHLQPVPVGAEGELYLAGDGLSRGYASRPGMTAERFVPCPFGAPGGRMYRVMDLVRRRADGDIEYRGRIDFQVKVRGFRIELGEIESRLVEHPGVRAAVVLAREDVPGDTRLVAYVAGDETAFVEALRAHLAERLPAYMVPAAYVRMDALPQTPNGKVDRKALPAPAGDAFAARGYEAPAGATEETVAGIWAEVVGAERVGRGDDFFELGGHSLLAVRVVSRVGQALGVEAAPEDLFERPVLADFARGLETAARAVGTVIGPVDRTGPLAPSFAQQRLWFLEQLDGTPGTYNIPLRLRLQGDLDRGALTAALEGIVARHEALRTTFPAVDGEPVQRIASIEESAFRLVEHDLRASADGEDALRRIASAEAGAPFDLEHGPLIRGRLIRTAEDEHVLLVTMHHVVSDGWSMGVFVRELGALYDAFHRGGDDPLPALPIQYADYAAWQRRRVSGDLLERQGGYWVRTLAGAPELLELPTDRPRPRKQDFAGDALPIELDEALTAALKALSRRHGTTLFMTLLAGWATVLGRLSGQTDVVVGTPTANRGRSETEALIGFFVNTLALRVDLSAAPTVAELLGQVRARALEAQQHPDIPFEQVVERVRPARSLAYSPLFQVMFAWQNTPGESLDLTGLRLVPEPETAQESALFDLTLDLAEHEGRITGTLSYATALFDRATVERHAGYLRRVLAEMAADEDRRVERLSLLPAGERALVVDEWNRTEAEYPADACVHELFEAQVRRTPEATALVWDGGSLAYAALNARANRLAHHLRALGVRPDVRVAICVERGPEMVVGLLAVLKAGGAYVPLDPAYPAERLEYMLADSRPAVLLASSSLAERFAGAGVPVLALDGDAFAGEPETDPERGGLTPEHLAYVIYTSGSTGRPKGVMVGHRGACNLVTAQVGAFGIEPDSRVLQFASFSFDASVSEVLTALCRGAALHLPPRGALLAGETLVRALDGITHVTLPPAVMATLPDDARLESVRTLALAGEALPEAVARRWGPGRRLINAYGPTEATVCATLHAWREGDEGSPPIGRPMANTRVYVLDPAGEPVPAGVAGELYVGGAGVARGYLDRPALTADRFVPDPFGGQPGARLYRTGDRGWWRADGTLEFAGRIDFQVKLRGFRIELGEIEARLAEHPSVREAAVVVREDVPGDRRLVAYCVADNAIEAERLRAHLGERLPEYMVPAAYVRLDALPLTPNGKLDRKALPAPAGDAFAARGYEAPSGPVEQAVAAIWAELLGAERVGRGDDFFHLGGHSLLGVRVVSRVRQALGVEAAPGDLFERPVLADFARGLETAARAVGTAIAPVDRTGALPPSFAQQRLWFLEQLGGTGAAYHIPVRLRLRGALDRGALVRALDRVVARHEALRTTFPAVDGEPVQHIASAETSAFHLVEHDLRASVDAEDALHRLMRDEMAAPFDLAHGPLIRGRLVRMAADDHVLLMTMHHIVSDGWSAGVLHRELGALYAAFARGDDDPLPPLPIQYADYAAWHRRAVEGDVLEAQAAYWTQTLAGAPELLELPADRPRPPRQDFAGASLDLALDEGLSDALKSLSQRHGTTLFMTLLAGWAAVLARLSGQDDVVIGTPSANRGRAEVEELIGFFVNTLPVRVDLSDGPSAAELLERVKARALEAQRNQDIPFEQVVERLRPVRSLAYTPLFQVMFAWQNAPGGDLALSGLTVADADAVDADTAKFDLSLTLWEQDGRIVGTLEYATALFDGATVERFAAYLHRVLEAMAAGGHGAVDQLPLLPDAERRQVLQAWNATDAAYPADQCIHQLFEAQAARTPQAVAVSHDDERVTYAELNARANRLAHHLRRCGVGPEVRVAICMERGVEMVVSMLAILKSGGAWVPLDPAHPVERLARMLSDSGAALLLTQDRLRATVPADASIGILAVDAEWGAIEAESAENPESGATPGGLAYVIYTSGSTGVPKGVGIEHRALVNHMAWFVRDFDVTASDRVLQKTPVVFDASVWEFYAPLLVGGELVMARHEGERDPRYLARTLRDRGIAVLQLVPSLLRVLLDEPELAECTALRHLFCGGEPLPGELVRRAAQVLPGVRITNLYGPAECCIDTSTHLCTEADGERAVVPIGSPVSNTRSYVLDAALWPVPVGVPGELCIGGVQVGRGYLGRAALTAEKFVPDPFGAEPGARLYRTGDRVRWKESAGVRECGSAEVSGGSGDSRTHALTHSRTAVLEFLGRTDFQVKIRGVRIELGEIEAALRDHEAVRDAIVLARADAPGEKRLVAYVVSDADVDVEALRAHLAARVPSYMVPAAYVRLDALPLTPNGKLDRKALPAPEGDAFAARGYEAPSGPVEQAVATIWAELLGVERVGRGDDFFELGGHSLLGVRVVSRVRQALGVDVSPGDLFERPVLADFARGLTRAASADAIERVDRSGAIPLSFAQQRLWFLEQMGNLGSTYHIPVRLRLKGALDPDALVGALDRIVARHEALRTTFPAVNGEPVQHIAPAETSAFHLVEHDLQASADAEDALHRLMRDEMAAPFDLAHGPLIRGRLVRMAGDDHVLLLTMHHVVSDGWSAGVLYRELGALYAAFARGDADPLPPLPIQYADYAAWHRRSVEGDVLEAQAAYWTETLAGAPELIELPADRPRPPRQDFAGASLELELDDGLAADLRTLSRRHGTTLFTTLLAGWAAVLARLSGQDDVVIGTPSANRGRAEVEELIGFFVNTLPVRVDLSDGPSVAELLERVKARALEAQRNQDIPFEQVVERARPTRSLAYTPLFQVMFVWQEETGGDPALPGLTVAGADAADVDTAKFDLTLSLGERDGRIAGGITYATALFDRATIDRFARQLVRLLELAVADPHAALSSLDLLSGDERAQLVEWNRTGRDFHARTALELFDGWVSRTPDAPALAFEGERLTFAELDTRTRRIARGLAARGVGPEARVGLCVERSAEMIVALLGIMRAGAAYVPLDPAFPPARMAGMLADAGVSLVLAQDALLSVLQGIGAQVVPIGEIERNAPDAVPLPEIRPESLAYVIYTSGSTGRPKGVAVEHRQLAHYVQAVAERLALPERASYATVSTIAADLGHTSVFGALCGGGCLHVIGGERIGDARAFAAYLADNPVDVLKITPSHLAALMGGADPAAVLPRRCVVVGGEASRAAWVDEIRALAPELRVVNHYGPTETTVGALAYVADLRLPDTSGGTVPIGRPLANARAYVLDDTLRPVPIGIPGELWIGGLGVARGYLGRAALTAERFIPDAFGGGAGDRLYRTGDRVRWLADGTLEYLGRLDEQVKVRGFRIELGEIEARLLEHGDVREAVVVARQDAPGETRLVAYVVGGEGAGANVLRAFLGETLPAYMVPAAFVPLEALPLTPNGKLDRKALPAPDADAFASRGYEAPAGPVEQAVADIWAELLGAERVGRGDDFFELGGHSLLAVRVVWRIRQALGVEASPGNLFERPVLADFARGLETAARAVGTAIAPVDRTGILPPSFAQQRLWFLEQMGNLGSTYHIPVRLRLKGALDRGALVRALDRIVARHEALRTTFPAVDGEPIQHVTPAEASAFRLVEHDLHASPDAEDALHRLMRDEAGAPFDLARGPLIRGRLVRMAADDHVLLLTMHHIVSDGWSAGVLHRELGALYAAFARGEADPLPPLAMQYADYAAWHRRAVEGDVLEAQAEYWTKTLAGAPELLELPTDRARPRKQDFAGALVDVGLDASLTAALKSLSQRHGATLFMTLLAGWATVLARLSGQDDVVVGTPSANRGRAEVEELIGFFVNTLPVRVDLSDGPRVADLLERVKARALEAQRNQDIPFEQVVERLSPTRSLAYSPLFQVLFAWQNAPGGDLSLPGLTVGTAGVAEAHTAKFDLSLTLWEDDGRIVGVVEYATALFDGATVRRFAGYLRLVLQGMVADEARRVDALPMLPAAERELVLNAWNDTDAGYPRGACVHEMFRAQAARTPDAVALSWRGETWTYAELDA